MQTNCALITLGIAIGESTPVVVYPCKDAVTSLKAGGKVTRLTTLMSLLMLSWAVAPHDLVARVTTSRRSSSTAGVASYTKQNSPIKKRKKKRKKKGRGQGLKTRQPRYCLLLKAKELPHQVWPIRSNSSLCH